MRRILMNGKPKNLPHGYMGNILTVDLSKSIFTITPLRKNITDLFFGGRGLGVALLTEYFISLERDGKYKNAFRKVDPLSGDNILIFSTSPTTGTGMPASGRFHVNFKSPLTEGIGSANSGGKWAVAFKTTGYDVLQITGRSETPVYLKISSGKVEFTDAQRLLDMNSEEITDLLISESPKGSRIMTIGEAGRRLSPIAAIMNDRGRALGRGGGGAVFGSKNLMAIVVNPNSGQKISVADEKGLDLKNESGAVFKAMMKLDLGKMTRKEKAYGILPSMGTLGLLGMVNNFNQLVHNNIRDTTHRIEDIEKISGEALRNHSMIAASDKVHIETKKKACYNCPIACTRVTKIVDKQGNIIDHGEGPELETVALLGANLSIYDLVAITEANYWANRYGLDTISLGGTIAAFVELHELIKNKHDEKTEREKDFLKDIKEFVALHGEPQFGRKEILLPLVHAMGKGEGIGRLLAQGSYRFCRHYGHEELSMTIKKLEMPAYDPRGAFLQGLCYEMNNRGACHLENGYTAIRDYCAGYAEWPGDRIEGTAIVARNAAFVDTVIDIIGACAFASLSITLDEFASLVNAVTGLNFNMGSLEQIAWRTLTLERIFNILAGFTDEDDWLPDRFYTETVEVIDSYQLCERQAFEQMHREYYEAMGWDSKGVPREKTLNELNITQIVIDKISHFR
jgi:aldehyde:ferredoxin oxidoreductase